MTDIDKMQPKVPVDPTKFPHRELVHPTCSNSACIVTLVELLMGQILSIFAGKTTNDCASDEVPLVAVSTLPVRSYPRMPVSLECFISVTIMNEYHFCRSNPLEIVEN